MVALGHVRSLFDDMKTLDSYFRISTPYFIHLCRLHCDAAISAVCD